MGNYYRLLLLMLPTDPGESNQTGPVSARSLIDFWRLSNYKK